MLGDWGVGTKVLGISCIQYVVNKADMLLLHNC